MRSITRLLLLPVLGLALIAASATAAAAQTEEDIEAHRVGAIWAKGAGSAELQVEKGRVAMVVNGDVTIVGPADLDVRINAIPAAAAGEGSQTIIVLDDFNGRIVVRGAEYSISVEGQVALHGNGSGQAQFVGQGWWKTRHHRGLWPAELPEAEIGFGAEAA
jgi:hypothetical protein